jgi:hypothetical protein
MKKILMTGIALSIVLTGCSLGSLKKADNQKLTADVAKEKALAFINENLMQPGSEATIDQPVIENGLYKIKVNLPGERSVDAYMTIDGKQFFPQAINMEEFAKQGEETGTEQEQADKPVTKSDKPKVEAFVMSHCPYGTQIEKGLLPAVKALGDAVDFKIKFVDYAMHDKKELDEQLAQYCIQSEQNGKFFAYLECFLKDGQSAACLKSTKVDEGKLKKCVEATDKKYDITKNYNDKSTWKGQFPPFNIDKELNTKYGVQGSPSLVINGTQVNSGRDAASLLKVMCDAMNKPAKGCSEKLSSATPSAGFGEGTDNSGAAAECGE